MIMHAAIYRLDLTDDDRLRFENASKMRDCISQFSAAIIFLFISRHEHIMCRVIERHKRDLSASRVVR